MTGDGCGGEGESSWNWRLYEGKGRNQKKRFRYVAHFDITAREIDITVQKL